MNDWGEATPMELLQAEVQAIRESVQHLKDCVTEALGQTAQRKGSPVRPEILLDEEWSK